MLWKAGGEVKTDHMGTDPKTGFVPSGGEVKTDQHVPSGGEVKTDHFDRPGGDPRTDHIPFDVQMAGMSDEALVSSPSGRAGNPNCHS